MYDQFIVERWHCWWFFPRRRVGGAIRGWVTRNTTSIPPRCGAPRATGRPWRSMPSAAGPCRFSTGTSIRTSCGPVAGGLVPGDGHSAAAM